MKNPLKMKSWSPYVVGAGIGVLSWFAFATANKPIGVTTAFEYSAALTEKAAAPQVTQPFLDVKAKDNKSPKIDWEWMLVLGVLIGAYASSKMSGDRAPEEKVRRGTRGLRAVPRHEHRRLRRRPARRDDRRARDVLRRGYLCRRVPGVFTDPP